MNPAGDQIAIVDANFPSRASTQNLVRADGHSASRMLQAILEVMPIDRFTDQAALSMQVIGDETTLPEAVKDFQQIINSVADSTTDISSLERFAFNEKAKSTFAIVATEDTRLYANLILTKGIIAP